jgi:hypothetical protein
MLGAKVKGSHEQMRDVKIQEHIANMRDWNTSIGLLIPMRLKDPT